MRCHAALCGCDRALRKWRHPVAAWEQGKIQGNHWKWPFGGRYYVANPPKNSITYAKNSLPKRNREFVGVKQEENRETKGAEQGIRVGHPPEYKVHRARRVHWLRFAEQ